MKVKINYTINFCDDEYEVEAETIEELKEIIKAENIKRHLHFDRNNMWSEEIK